MSTQKILVGVQPAVVGCAPNAQVSNIVLLLENAT